MNSSELEQLRTKCFNALNRLAKWRVVFVGWQLGTRMKGDAEADAVRDHRELTIALRVEVNAMIGLLVDKNLITQEEWFQRLTKEAESLEKDYEARFPGYKATDVGMTIDVQQAVKTSEGWPK